MKELWIEIDSKTSAQEKESLLSISHENADVILEGDQASTRNDKLEIVFLSDLNEKNLAQLKKEGKKTAFRVTIQGKEDENKAAKAADIGVDYVIINCLDWRVIPLENLIAKGRGKSTLIAEVTTSEDAKVVLEALELGTDGVLLKTGNPNELEKTIKLIKSQ
ncbi:hypothetical protein E4G67_04385, partial [Candidatus Bathyarchaeota archaeon]